MAASKESLQTASSVLSPVHVLSSLYLPLAPYFLLGSWFTAWWGVILSQSLASE